MRIAFIGLGNVGQPLAMNLARAGHTLTVTDLDQQRGRPLVDAGARFAFSVAEAVQDCELAITSLPNPQTVEKVVPGPDGLLANLRKGCAWIEMSTTDAAAMLQLARQAEELGIDVLEAPITGGANRVWTGDISILVGGDPGVFERYRPVLEIMGGDIELMGPIGQASVVKVITNMLAFVHLWASGEALMLAKRAGVDLDRAFHGIRISSGNSFAHETEAQLVLNGSYNVGFTMDLALKDIGLALDLARETETPLEMLTLVSDKFEQARAAFGDKAWSTQAVKVLEDRLGEPLRARGFPSVLPGMEQAGD